MRWPSFARLARGIAASLALWDAPSSVGLPAAVGQTCPGDCGGDGAVAIEELIKGVEIALGRQSPSECIAIDASGDGAVDIDELIGAVSAALHGCAGGTATPTPEIEETATVTPTSVVAQTPTPTETPPPTPAPPTSSVTPLTPRPFCELPGSVQTTAAGLAVVPGGPAGTPDLTFINLPIGFCVHYFADVGNTRQLRFAPGGELFVASPTRVTSSNGLRGRAAIVVLPDDDRDGTADTALTFMDGMNETIGLLFTGGFLYFQDGTRILRVPYAAGDRRPSGDSEEVANITLHISSLHWQKALDVADDGTIYVTNGGDDFDPCPMEKPFLGGILKLQEGKTGGVVVAKGFRNPISLRCVRRHGMCFAIELTRDFSTRLGGREKLVPIRDGDDWGFPCCATKDRPYDDRPGPDCSGVAEEINSFFVGHTPFDLDFELGRWPEPWGNRAYVAIHGAVGSWTGARVVGIELDAMTGQVLPGSDLSGMSTGGMADFATGWTSKVCSGGIGTCGASCTESSECPGGGVCVDRFCVYSCSTNADCEVCSPAAVCLQGRVHGRPTVVAFAPDGRLFMGNDTNGDIIWIAPMELTPPPELQKTEPLPAADLG